MLGTPWQRGSLSDAADTYQQAKLKAAQVVVETRIPACEFGEAVEKTSHLLQSNSDKPLGIERKAVLQNES